MVFGLIFIAAHYTSQSSNEVQQRLSGAGTTSSGKGGSNTGSTQRPTAPPPPVNTIPEAPPAKPSAVPAAVQHPSQSVSKDQGNTTTQPQENSLFNLLR